jgi:hypothetical protein
MRNILPPLAVPLFKVTLGDRGNLDHRLERALVNADPQLGIRTLFYRSETTRSYGIALYSHNSIPSIQNASIFSFTLHNASVVDLSWSVQS